MAKIEKKAWAGIYDLFNSGERKLEIRLADFDLKSGDSIILKEYDPKMKKYTGRQTELKCKHVEQGLKDPLRFYDADKVKKHGFYIIEFE